MSKNNETQNTDVGASKWEYEEKKQGKNTYIVLQYKSKDSTFIFACDKASIKDGIANFVMTNIDPLEVKTPLAVKYANAGKSGAIDEIGKDAKDPGIVDILKKIKGLEKIKQIQLSVPDKTKTPQSSTSPTGSTQVAPETKGQSKL